MRTSHVATAVAAVTAGLTAATVLRGMTARRQARPLALEPAAVPGRDAVVLPFARPLAIAPVVAQPAMPAKCGDTGGLTKAGAPCGARANSSGRCHHHALAA